MDILKYIDVLIGLAVVMLLLSPLVSAITQLWIWLSNTRSGRLQVGLKKLILQLDGNPYQQFGAAEVTGLPPAAVVTLGGAGFPPVSGPANPAGTIVFLDNIPGRLSVGDGSLAITSVPPPAGALAVTLVARGPVGDWTITSKPTNAGGIATATYAFPGPEKFTSWRGVAALPPGVTLTSARMTSGALKGTPLIVAAGTITYPPNARPVARTHDLEIALAPAAAGVTVTFTFERNPSFDQPQPAPASGNLTESQAEEIARAVLLHPMIAKPSFLIVLRGMQSMRGEVIQREEFIRVLLGFAAGEGAGGGLSTDSLTALRLMIGNNGITEPVKVLGDIGHAAQELEKSNPTAATHVRLTKAILVAAQSPFVGKINNWFDQAMDRTTAEYRFRAQIVTVIGALVVALAVQMDSLDLLKRLSTDDKLRDSLVKQAEVQQKRMDDQAQTAAQNQDEAQDEIQLAKTRRDEIETNLAQLRDPAMAILPDHFIWQPLPRARLVSNPAWKPPYIRRLELVVGANSYALEPNWTGNPDPLVDIRDAIANSGATVTASIERSAAGVNNLVLTSGRLGLLQLRSVPGRPESNMLNSVPEQSCPYLVCFDYEMLKRSWLGVLITWMLLSLGASFWYDALKDLLKLRSPLASKEEAARKDRQTSTAKQEPAKTA